MLGPNRALFLTLILGSRDRLVFWKGAKTQPQAERSHFNFNSFFPSSQSFESGGWGGGTSHGMVRREIPSTDQHA